MLRYLSPGRGSSAHLARQSDQAVLTLHVPNYGLIIMPAPGQEEGEEANGDFSPRADHMLHGELEVRLPGTVPRRCKAIRVGFRTVITLDLDRKRREREEDVLFERKVEVVANPEDGIIVHPGSQRFDFTIILPGNLAPHDWHPNGTIQHYLYAEIEGLPEPADFGMSRVGSSTSLFSFRNSSRARTTTNNTGSNSRATSRSRAPSRANSRPGSRQPSPGPSRRSVAQTAPASGAASPRLGAQNLSPTPHALAGALANLNLDPNGTAPMTTSPLPSPGLPGVKPAYLSVSARHSMALTHEDLPRTPSYENAMAAGTPGTPGTPITGRSSGADTPPEWLNGTTRVNRKLMLVYNPDLSGGASGFDDETNGYVKGLGVWDWSMISDVWSISALLGTHLKITSIPPKTTIFAMRVLLAQTHSIISPRDTEGKNKVEGTRHFCIVESGKRPPPGHHHPDRHYPALWRGTGVPGGKDEAVPGTDGGELTIDTQGRLPTDDVGRPSTLPGVVTPINVTHNLALEVYFSVWGEDDRGEAMKLPGPGGLRLLRVSRPVTLPSCTLVPQIIDLPRYGDHEKDPFAPPTPSVLPEENQSFGWTHCACGQKLDEMQTRMKAATVAERGAQRTDSTTSLADMFAAAQAADKASADRGRQMRNGSV